LPKARAPNARPDVPLGVGRANETGDFWGDERVGAANGDGVTALEALVWVVGG
jgi:hypothetical protein